MNSNQEQFSAEFEAENTPSVDDFLKELEAKEKDLNISSEMVVEVEEDISDEHIPEFLRAELAGNNKSPLIPSLNNHFPANFQIEKTEEKILRGQIAELESECKELKNTLSRRQKDFDNYRQRTEREKGETFRNQVGNVATELLPVLDNLNRALDVASGLANGKTQDFQQFYEGIELVSQQLNEVLADMGVEPILSIGEPFDPQFHDAVAAEESEEYPPNYVIGELVRGYRLGEKLIRPAMVKVSSPGSNGSESKAEHSPAE
ncbi:MAG TPA: nucleotide exchange factor GrpE [Pyrinomonadaceae bacterium]|nr:nucleotide exchange factor GrpE [Pyrinomonadaceae bacterium]